MQISTFIDLLMPGNDLKFCGSARKFIGLFRPVFRSHVLFCTLGFSVFATPAHAIPPRVGAALLPLGAHLREGRISRPPMGFAEFCLRWPDQCSSDVGAPFVVLTVERLRELQRINSSVNASIEPVPLGKKKYEWRLFVRSGACSEYALEKRRRLIEAGWPKAALSLTAVQLLDGQYHLILTIRTDRGDYVLDNLSSLILNVDKISYRMIEMQSAMHPQMWVLIDDEAREPMLAE